MDRRDLFFIFFGSFLIVYIILPIATILVKQAFDLDALIEAVKDPAVRSAIANSLLCSTITTTLALMFGVPLGYVLARYDFRGKSIVQGIVDVPIVIPHSVVGIMLLVTFSNSIVDNYFGIILAMLFVSASFTINSARDGFLAIDESLEHVARTLGAGRLRTFFTVTLPIAMRSILSGAIMTWARAISEVGAILIVAYYPKTAPVLILDYFDEFGLKRSMPIAVLLIVICLMIFILLRWSLCSRSSD